MGDVFKEQLVKQPPTRKDAQIKAAVVAGGIVVTLLAYTFFFQIIPLAVAAAGFGIYYTFSMISREFEYIFTSGELDIDCIRGKSRRKAVFSGTVKEFIFLTHISDTNAERLRELQTASEVLMCGAGGDDAYVILTSYNGKRVKIVFDPNDMMLASMKPYLGGKKFFDRER